MGRRSLDAGVDQRLLETELYHFLRPYGIAFRRNEPDLHAAVERALRNLVIERDIGPLYSRWFESKLPNGETLGLPMSPQLEESFKVLGEGSEPNQARATSTVARAGRRATRVSAST